MCSLQKQWMEFNPAPEYRVELEIALGYLYHHRSIGCSFISSSSRPDDKDLFLKFI